MNRRYILSLFITLGIIAESGRTFEADIWKNPFYCLSHSIRSKFEEKEQKLNEQQEIKADDCPKNDHMIESSIPYWNKNDNFPCMYAGTFEVSVQASQSHNLFYWFFRNTSLVDPPLVLWLNGGPGSSSMFGLLLENGPIKVERTDDPDNEFLVSLDPLKSWGEVADVVYLDQPVGTGFSYGTSYLDRLEDGAVETVNFLVQFMDLHQLWNRTFIITGESYAGKYIPHLALKVFKHNQQQEYNQAETQKIFNLKHLLIGDPFVNPIKQSLTTYLIAEGLAMVDSEDLKQVAALRRKCEEGASGAVPWGGNVTDNCDLPMLYITEMNGGVLEYNVDIFSYEWDPIEQVYIDFLNSSRHKDDLYKALHIDQSTKSPKFMPSNGDVYNYYQFEEMLDWTSFYDEAKRWQSGIEDQLSILIYAGEYDQLDGPLLQEIWMKGLQHPSLSSGALWNSPRQIFYVNDTAGSQFVGGYWRTDPNARFTLLAIPKAGHFVPTNQPLVAKQFLKDYIANGQLTCHLANSSYCNTTDTMCKYMNQCNGNGACNTNGKCDCTPGYKGADCSKKAENLTDGYSKSFTLNGTQWVYFTFSEGLSQSEYYELTLSATYSLDVFILSGDQDPNEFQFDLTMKKQSYVVISSKAFPTMNKFTAAVRINGIEFNGNIYHETRLLVYFTKTGVTYEQQGALYYGIEDEQKVEEKMDKLVYAGVGVIGSVVATIIGFAFKRNVIG